jgi:microcystin-dependent protein
MSQPYIGEIRMFAGNFAPAGWAFCNGQIIPISENDTLFNLIGTTYGGDGQSTFALPNLQSRVPMHQGNGFVLAQAGGAESVTLTVNQIPAHSHVAIASSASGPNQSSSLGSSWVGNDTLKPYNTGTNVTNNMATTNIGFTGGTQPHDNVLPFLGINYIISLFGVFPTPT